MNIPLIISLIFSLIAGFVYSFDKPILIDNLHLFYILCVVLLVILFLISPKHKINYSNFLGKNDNKVLGLTSSFLLLTMAVFHIFVALTSNADYFEFILPILSLMASFSIAKVTISLNRGEFDNKISSFIVLPVFFIIAELLLLFKSNSGNPLFSEFIVLLLAEMALASALYQFASLFCSNNKKNYFVVLNNFSIFLTLSVGFALIFSFVLKTDVLTLNFSNIRLFISLLSCNLFLIQYIKRTSLS